MKPKISLAWFIISLALGWMLFVQWRSIERIKTLNETLQLQVEKLDQETKTAQSEANEARSELLDLRGDLRGVEIELVNTRAAYASAMQATNFWSRTEGNEKRSQAGELNEGNISNMIQQMMENPEMARMMHEQQKGILNLMYAPLITELGLDEEQSHALKELMLNRQMAAMTNGGSMLSKDPAKRKEAAAQVAVHNDAVEDKIKNLLGDKGYSRYQDYNTTVGERMTLNLFSNQSNLPTQTSHRLLEIMIEEKKMMQANVPEVNTDRNRDWQNFARSEEFTQRYLEQQEHINSRVLARAQELLTPEQLKQFSLFQKSQLDMHRMGMKMAKTMMGIEGAADSTPSQVAPQQGNP